MRLSSDDIDLVDGDRIKYDYSWNCGKLELEVEKARLIRAQVARKVQQSKTWQFMASFQVSMFQRGSSLIPKCERVLCNDHII
jgi:hypothetical protein